MLPAVLLCIGWLAGPALAADVDVLRLRSNLDRNAQDQQLVRQQIQLTQGLLRAEESSALVMQSYTRLPMSSRHDLLLRQADALPAGARPHQDELDRLAVRYRDLEQQQRRLQQNLSTRRPYTVERD